MAKTTIEWTEQSWNPATGCTKVSEGCRHCYAERMALRLQAMGHQKYCDGFAVRTHPDQLDVPARIQRASMFFVCSMGDLFHEEIPAAFVQSVFDTMRRSPHHRFQVLTKRSHRIAELQGLSLFPCNMWLGVSVENQQAAVTRVKHLKAASAAVRFLSCEPLLGPLPGLPLNGIDWVIVGGESGPGARRMHADWVRSIRDQCGRAGVPFFFKQWGGVNKHKTGRVLDGETYDGMPRLKQ